MTEAAACLSAEELRIDPALSRVRAALVRSGQGTLDDAVFKDLAIETLALAFTLWSKSDDDLYFSVCNLPRSIVESALRDMREVLRLIRAYAGPENAEQEEFVSVSERRLSAALTMRPDWEGAIK